MQLVEPHDHAGLRGGTGQPNDVLGADIGGDDRGTDHESAHVAAREEAVRRGILPLPQHPPGQSEEDGEVAAHH